MGRPIVYGPAGSTYVWSTRLALAEKGVRIIPTHCVDDRVRARLSAGERFVLKPI